MLMLNAFRKLFSGRGKVRGDIELSEITCEGDTEYRGTLLLDRFLKPRVLAKAAPGWPDKMVTPILRNLIERGDIALSSLDRRIEATYRIKDIKPILKERGLPVSGKKALLVQRLVDSGFEPDENVPEVYECTDSGKAKALDWANRRDVAIRQAIDQAIELLRNGHIRQAMKVAHNFNDQWPTMQDIALRFNPMAIPGDPKRAVRQIEIILSSRPTLLGGTDSANLECVRMAVSLLRIGLPRPGIEIAMEGYVESDGISAHRAVEILSTYAHNLGEIERMQTVCNQAELNFIEPCSQCAQLDGKTYSLKALPELPNPQCIDSGCIFDVRAIIDD